MTLAHEQVPLRLGPVAGDEVVQLYVKKLESERVQPLKKLRAFKRISLKPGESNTIQFDLSGEDFRFWNEEKGDWELEAGEFEIQIGNSSQNILLKEKIR